MKTEKNIFIAFILNLIFSIAECIGGYLIGSTAIISDSLHDFGDALSIGLSCLFERISKKSPDEKYTFGYGRFSILGSIITSVVLIIGSITVFCNAISKLHEPQMIKYNEMIFFSLFGISANFIGMYVTRGGKSMNLKSVNLHMLEDVLGWIAVLIGGIIMKFTGITIIDPIISIAISVFIFIHALKHLKKGVLIILERAPEGINIRELKNEILKSDNINDIAYLRVWQISERDICAEISVVTTNQMSAKNEVANLLTGIGIKFLTIETN